ncbi:hypothetical protein BDK51DRAFT_46682 [Blyttiomyces helicus]|uniref:Uncharacterized protein n=1 Tax=Blyttiomyces helicus TaxID=388810 RepID=A0A4P9WH62_9FUNG|nr:hypothetical protein BDK51DRAFT_46682 [Blyttiomyces helicus]|eukprot:RKO92064.1 hypothetical protein BDK51DRAFT_46682 [Blyttiomyces helicus]
MVNRDCVALRIDSFHLPVSRPGAAEDLMTSPNASTSTMELSSSSARTSSLDDRVKNHIGALLLSISDLGHPRKRHLRTTWRRPSPAVTSPASSPARTQARYREPRTLSGVADARTRFPASHPCSTGARIPRDKQSESSHQRREERPRPRKQRPRVSQPLGAGAWRKSPQKPANEMPRTLPYPFCLPSSLTQCFPKEDGEQIPLQGLGFTG